MILDSQKMTNNIQFEKWSPDQVAEWLRGLDMNDAMIPYMHYFLNAGVDGKKLMLMTHGDLEKLNVLKFGHQELIMEAVDLLRNLRFGYETENLQSLALQLSCKSQSLKGEVKARFGENDRNRANTNQGDGPTHRRVSISILSAVADLVSTLKSLVGWMDKAPFCGAHELCLVRNTIVKLGLEMITICQKDVSSLEHNLSEATAELSEICEKLVIGSTDSPLEPLYLQPASLEQAIIRKKQGEELGMNIQMSCCGVHLISGVKDMSPADLCGKIEKEDEVIQVNSQIVVGWSLKNLVNLLKENHKEIMLYLKKRPRHIAPYGQMPNRKKHEVQASTLPKSRKKLRSRDGDSTKLRPSLQEFVNTAPNTEEVEDLDSPKETNDGNDTDNDVFRSGSESPQFTQYTLPVQPDPKQRRATVSGGSPTLSRPLLVIEDIDTPSRPKSFTIASTTANMPHEIIINSPSGENLTELNKLSTAGEKRQEYKTKSTPPSLEFSVRKPTPQIVEPNQDGNDDKTNKTTDKITDKTGDPDFSEVAEKLSEIGEKADSNRNNKADKADGESRDKPTEPHELNKDKALNDSVFSPGLDRFSQSPERLLDSSTDSVPPSESSMESSQTYTSSLESSSHSPPPPHEETVISKEPKKEKHVDFKGVDSDEEDTNSYVCVITGGVPQKLPANPQPQVQIRPKTHKTKKVRGDRRISCKDLGTGDCEGWLLKRKTKGHILPQSHWHRRWCVIKNYNLFCFHDMEAVKAEVVIHLPAFQISPIDHSEVKTKKHAFKIHNSGTSFCFASDRQEDMSKWMNKMGLAAISFSQRSHVRKPEPGRYAQQNSDFSESDTDDASSVGSRGNSRSGSPELSLRGSIGSTAGSAQSSPKIARAEALQAPAPEMRASQEDLTVMLRKQTQGGTNFYGEDKNRRRRTAISRDMESQVTPEIVAMKKKTALERTLRAKELELKELEQAMLSAKSLHHFKERFDHDKK